MRRTVPVGTDLYALAEREVAALDISNRDAPRVVASVDISEGDGRAPEEVVDGAFCSANWMPADLGNDVITDHPAPFACAMLPNKPALRSAAPLFALPLVMIALRRRRSRAPAR